MCTSLARKTARGAIYLIKKVDALVSALGSQSGISKPQVSRICHEFDEQVQAFLSRPLQETGYACVDLDAT
jgi:putative transposase